MNWLIKLIAKCIVSRLPVPYSFWRTLGAFRHGQMDSVDYSTKVFNLHSSRAFPSGLAPNSVILEVGPGDSIISALLAVNAQVEKTILVDAGRFAREEIHFYKSAVKTISSKGITVPNLQGVESFSDLLALSNTAYMTEGLESLKSIPSESVDFIWSHSVLEHIRKHEVEEFLFQLQRVLKPGGRASHNIDYQDHLDHALNNLRFSCELWESNFFVNSGFYTNRIPAIKMHEMFRNAGFNVLNEEFGTWPSLPTPRKAIHKDYDSYTDDDLSKCTSSILLTK